MTLTPLQREVLTKMRDGWELSEQCVDPYACWLFNDVSEIRVHRNTFESLVFCNPPLVQRCSREFPAQTYTLTPAGREAVEDTKAAEVMPSRDCDECEFCGSPATRIEDWDRPVPVCDECHFN